MKTRKELNRAVARLRRVNRAAAETHAHTYAESLLHDAARRRSVTDFAALAIVSVALYCAATTCVMEERGFRTVQRIVDRWYALLLDGNSADRIFVPNVFYPERLEAYRRDLTCLPPAVLAAGMTMVREAVQTLR